MRNLFSHATAPSSSSSDAPFSSSSVAYIVLQWIAAALAGSVEALGVSSKDDIQAQVSLWLSSRFLTPHYRLSAHRDNPDLCIPALTAERFLQRILEGVDFCPSQ